MLVGEELQFSQNDDVPIGGPSLSKEGLGFGIVSFIITDDHKACYYRSLQNWETERGYLRDTCGLAQDRFKQVMEYFNIALPD
jgi:hypothetical protein